MVYYELLVISCSWRLGETGGQVQGRVLGAALWTLAFRILVILHWLPHPIFILVCCACSRFPCPLAPRWLGQSLGWSEGGGKSHKHLFPCCRPALALWSESGPASLGYCHHQAAPSSCSGSLCSPGDLSLPFQPTAASSWIPHQCLLVLLICSNPFIKLLSD